MALHDENVVWHAHAVTREDREALHGHKGAVVWFTGLSGSGKSTVAGALEEALHKLGVSTWLLDGDNVRHGLCSDLGFSDADRKGCRAGGADGVYFAASRGAADGARAHRGGAVYRGFCRYAAGNL